MWPKIEKTREQKGVFMSLYWGQKIFRYREVEKRTPQSDSTFVDNYTLSPTLFFDDSYLLLTSLDDITDEDLEVCYHLHNSHIAYDGTMDFGSPLEMAKHWIEMSNGYKDLYGTPIIVDYLRSKGYALPYLTLSVAEQITYGWIKLKNF